MHLRSVGSCPSLFLQPLLCHFSDFHQATLTLTHTEYVWVYFQCTSCLKVFTHTAALGLNLSTPHMYTHMLFERLTSHPLSFSLNAALFISEVLPDQSSHFPLHIDTHNLKALIFFFRTFSRIIVLICYSFVSPLSLLAVWPCSILCYIPYLAPWIDHRRYWMTTRLINKWVLVIISCPYFSTF